MYVLPRDTRCFYQLVTMPQDYNRDQILVYLHEACKFNQYHLKTRLTLSGAKKKIN